MLSFLLNAYLLHDSFRRHLLVNSLDVDDYLRVPLLQGHVDAFDVLAPQLAQGGRLAGEKAGELGGYLVAELAAQVFLRENIGLKFVMVVRFFVFFILQLKKVLQLEQHFNFLEFKSF